jgi:hypothetical protein
MDTLNLAVLVPISDSTSSARPLLGAVAFAIDAVNNLAILGGKKLEFVWKEVRCDSSAGSAALSQMLDAGPIDAVIGPDCDVSCESTGFLTAGRRIPQISYSCASTLLSDKSKYPTVRARARSHRAACLFPPNITRSLEPCLKDAFSVGAVCVLFVAVCADYGELCQSHAGGCRFLQVVRVDKRLYSAFFPKLVHACSSGTDTAYANERHTAGRADTD